MVMVKPNQDEIPRYESGNFPENFKDDIAKMGAFNETLINDVMIVDMGGLKPTSKGTRIDYSGAKPQITDGPFAETKELIAGFWLLEAPSKEELVKRLSQCPFQNGESIEIRPLFSDEDLKEFF
ncbi:MAG TPA: YciI family protein [Candidatus Baltobacteraceae bacterium]|nr:YciI family protein [Candidatus Baltobacteraceae bacterium]